MIEQGKIFFFDTNSLNALKLRTERANLFKACKDGQIQGCISETVIREQSNQKFLFYIHDDPTFPTLEPSEEERLFPALIIFHKELYTSHCIKIIYLSKLEKVQVQKLVEDPSSSFDPNDDNDIRDAEIYLSAINNFKPDEIICVCEDINLGQEFLNKGFTVRDNAKLLVKELFGDCKKVEIEWPKVSLKLIDQNKNEFIKDFTKDIERETLDQEIKTDGGQDTSALDQFQENLGSTDAALRLKLLGYVAWHDPITKKYLEDLLGHQHFPLELIQNNADRLCIEKVIKKTDNYYMVNKKNQSSINICEQAKLLMLDEITQELEKS